MNESLQLLLKDIREVVAGLNIRDMLRIFMVSIWFLIVLFPLGKHDARDLMVAAMYVLFSIVAGVILVFALPQKLMPPQSFEIIVTTLIFMGLIAWFRWKYSERRQIIYETKMMKEHKHVKPTREGEISGSEQK
ncbi:MAG: hypothetical protein HQK54_16075 [Oligoflexales bacterium]|nr:hypothetical protein [Oligoflexales bacterium]